jgi:tetratricopeptide (TPR) repeat protein
MIPFTKCGHHLGNSISLWRRIRVKQERAGGALPLLEKSIKRALDGKLTNQLVVAYIAQGEAHSALRNYSQAVESFGEARKNNEQRIVAGFEVSSERNRAWILLSLAEAHLRVNEVGQAKKCLKEWRSLGGVELQWLIDKAGDLVRLVEAYESQTFTIESDPDGLQWKRRRAELASWLIDQARKHTGSGKKEDMADMLGISTNWLGLLEKLGRDDAPPVAKVSVRRRRKKE